MGLPRTYAHGWWPNACGRNLGIALGWVVLAVPASRAQLIITTASSAPVANVQFSQPVDNHYDNIMTKSAEGEGSGFGQSFTPETGFDLAAITLQLSGSSSGPYYWAGKDVKFEVYQMTSGDDDIPDATLYSGTATLPAAPADLADGRYLTFAFTAVTLSADTTYAWGLIPVSVNTNGLGLSFAGASPKTILVNGRNLGYSDASGWDNGYFNNGDVKFYAVETAAVPEPAAEVLLLGLAALVAAAGWRWRQRQHRA